MAAGRKTGGRTKGTPNKVTTDTRALISELAEKNAHNVQSWLDTTAKESPGKALDLYIKLLEFSVPKLVRAEHIGEDGGPIQAVFNVRIAS